MDAQHIDVSLVFDVGELDRAEAAHKIDLISVR
jgi:hypothetical protein